MFIHTDVYVYIYIYRYRVYEGSGSREAFARSLLGTLCERRPGVGGAMSAKTRSYTNIIFDYRAYVLMFDTKMAEGFNSTFCFDIPS